MNGGSVEEKVDFGYNLFEQTVSVDSVFQPNEMLDTIAITKGKGTEGVVTRWGVTRLPRKTHRGLRKVSLECTLLCHVCDYEFLTCASNLTLRLLLFHNILTAEQSHTRDVMQTQCRTNASMGVLWALLAVC